MTKDLQFALRSLRRNPGFFGIAVLTLGLGIASTTGIFSLFYQVLLRSLPVPAPRELVLLHTEDFQLPGGAGSDNSETVYSYPMYLKLRDGLKTIQLAARAGTTVQVLAEGATERADAEVVTGNFFETLQLRPFAGRLLASADDVTRGGHPVAVLAHGYWQRRFGGKLSMVGQKVTLNGLPFEVIGITPPEFHGFLAGNKPEIYLPVAMRAAIAPGVDWLDRPNMRWMTMLGRLRNGTPREQASAELKAAFAAELRAEVEGFQRLSAKTRERILGFSVELRPAASGLNELERNWSEPLRVLLGMVSLLLLIACANLANLLLARGVNRAKEIAIRLSIGASRGDIVRLLLTETMLIAVGGAAVGVLLAPELMKGILRFFPATVESGWLRPELNGPVLLFSIGLAALATLLAGLAPALQVSRPVPRGPIHDRSRKFFVAAQVALSLVLLATAGLFARSLGNLMQASPGFQPQRVTNFTLEPGMAGYDVPRGLDLYRNLQQGFSELPGVQSVTYADNGPFSHSSSSTNVSVEGYTTAPEENTDCLVQSVGPQYFQTLGNAMVAGRDFDERDREGSAKVAVVNQAFVRRFLPKVDNPVGRHMSRGAGGPLDLEIVGVAADTKNADLREAAKPTYFQVFAQSQGKAKRVSDLRFYVRSTTATDALAGPIRAVVARADTSLPVTNLQTLQKQVEESYATDTLIATLAVAFGVLALVITAIGLYGVLSYLTERRTAEVGIRMALGATAGNILRLVLGEVGVLVGAGAFAGWLGALAAGRAIESQLFGVGGVDPLVLTAAPLVLGLVALLAALGPCLRASRVHPMEALRHQ